MISELHFVIYIRIFFDHCHVAFPYKEIFSFVGHCHVAFPYMYVISILGNSLCNSKVCCFQIHFVTSFRNIHIIFSPLCYKQYPAFTQNSQKKVLFFKLHLKNTLFVKTTASPITTTRRVFTSF